MFVVQNENRPNAMQGALFDLMREGVSSVRVCSAYMTKAGSELLFNAVRRTAENGNTEGLGKTIVASLDFGMTDPNALRFWRDMPNSRVFVAGRSLLERHTLIPKVAFHPKLYVFDRPNGTVASLVGSANLTNRGLTINSEVGWSEFDEGNRHAAKTNEAWNAIVQLAVPLTDDILNKYEALRSQASRQRQEEELAPVPAPSIEEPSSYRLFSDAVENYEDAYNRFSQLWIQSLGMQGGSRTQLELPRGANRFFGAQFDDYQAPRVERIAEPILICGRQSWTDRPLTWHGDNRMERINLPSQRQGGFDYEKSLILFRRVAENTFELRAYPWNSDSAHAYVEASRRRGLVFRIGRNSTRLAGFLP